MVDPLVPERSGGVLELKDQRKVAALPRQPLLAEPRSVQLPRFVFRWLVGDEAGDGRGA